MAIKSNNHNFKLSLGFQNDEISNDNLIHLIIREVRPNRRRIASRQLTYYFNQILSHPHMRSVYIAKIKQLIKVETKRGAKSE
ncbi:MAG: hypothetical protein ACFFG0_16865 [Candidatus Thorarchaeota archaeon]